jgi:hypothetical protein
MSCPRIVRGLCTTWVVLAPVSAEAWIGTVGGAGADEGRAIVQTADRGFVVAGATDSAGLGGRDVLVLRLDACGTPIWQTVWGAAGDEQAFAVAALAGGGSAVAGETETASGDLDLLLIELDAAGSVVGQLSVGGAADESARAVVALPDGGLAVAGTTGADGWVLRLDAARNVLWQRSIGGAGEDVVAAVGLTPAGRLLAAGRTDSFGAGFADGWLVELELDGDLVAEQAYGGPGDDGFAGVAAAPGGGFVAAGFTDSSGAGLFDAWVVRADALGGPVWERTLGDVDDDEALAVAPTTLAARTVVAGRTLSLDPGVEDGWAVALDDTGAVTWTRRIGGAADDSIAAATSALGGGVALAGATESIGSGGAQVWVTTLDAAGDAGDACTLAVPAVLGGVPAAGTWTGGRSAIVDTVAVRLILSRASRSARLPSMAACPPAPGEVSPPGSLAPLVFTDDVTLAWEAPEWSCAESFNLYRADLAGLPADSGDCLAPDIPSATAADLDLPRADAGFAYLVTGEAAALEGPAGHGSDGSPRVLATPCP